MRLSEVTTAMEREGREKIFNRCAIAMLRGGARPAQIKQFAIDEARKAWSDTPNLHRVIDFAAGIHMVAVAGFDGGFSDADRALWADASTAFISDVRAASILGRIEGAVHVSFSKSAIENVSHVGAGWTQSGRAIPVRSSTYSTIAPMVPKKVAGLVVASSEIATTPTAERNIGAELRRAVIEQLDRTFVSDAVADAATPAGIAANAISITSSGTTVAQIVADLVSMIDAQVGSGGEPKDSVWIVPVGLWARYTALKIADAQGTLCGLPVIASASATRLILLAARQLVIAAGDEVLFASSDAGTIEMLDTPTGSIVEPTGATASSAISLFQNDARALRASIPVNWTVAGPQTSDGAASVVKLEP